MSPRQCHAHSRIDLVHELWSARREGSRYILHINHAQSVHTRVRRVNAPEFN